jgi:chorismate mutase
MAHPDTTTPKKYTCNEYREEMILAALQRQLASPDLSPETKEQLLTDIEKLEIAMGLN